MTRADPRPADAGNASGDRFADWLEARGPAPPRRRVAVAAAAALVGWIAGSVVTLLLELFTIGGRWGDVLWFDLLIGLFAGLAWLVAVPPLALFGDHDGWLFRPLTAPVLGVIFGKVLLMLELWAFFDAPPTRMIEGGIEFGEAYLFFLAAVVGAVTWWCYTRWMRARISL